MNDLKFDIYALVKPKTKADVAALLQEALSELQEINMILDDVMATLEEDQIIEDEDFINVQRMLIEYFNIEVPLSVLKEICISSPELMQEALSNSERDTFARDSFIDAVLDFYSLPSWPINADPKSYRDFFEGQLNFKAPLNENGVRVFSKLEIR